MATINVPSSALDLFADHTRDNPYPAYAALRECGPAVYLTAHEVWALPQYASVRQALGDHATFSSAAGVGLYAPFNELTQGSIIASDPPHHDVLRSVVSRFLGPKALREQTASINEIARSIVEQVVEMESFDAVEDLAERVPMAIVADLVGLPDEGRDQLLDWAAASFDAFGPESIRSEDAVNTSVGMLTYVMNVATADRVRPGSVAAGIYGAAEDGEIDSMTASLLLTALVQAGMDTTINAISAAVALFSAHPDQWDIVREDPTRIPAAFREVLRYESPVQVFSRVLTRDWPIGDLTLPEGARVIVLFGSANRDERKWPNAEIFDVQRNPLDQLAFGYGIHACVGQALARLEGHAVLSALASTVRRFEVRNAERKVNSVLRGYQTLPCTIYK